MEQCKICRGDYGDNFVVINGGTVPYSGIELALNKQGLLRVRYYDDTSISFKSQDVIKLIHCPICGCLKNPIID